MNAFLDWLALLIVAGAVFLTISKLRQRRMASRRSEFLKRFKAMRHKAHEE